MKIWKREGKWGFDFARCHEEHPALTPPAFPVIEVSKAEGEPDSAYKQTRVLNGPLEGIDFRTVLIKVGG